ncbi:MAG: DUF1648 domain-containing protein [Phycisphaerae bacterium]|nr:DUF1648 domain-containing protein [Phycisphaerae bacterium]
MRILFLLLCLANIAVAVGMIWWMPDPMATHFGPDNQADDFMSPAGYVVFFSGLVVFFAGLFLCIPWLMRVLPVSAFNMPNRDFWMNQANRPRTLRRVEVYMDSLGIAMMLLFLLLQWLTFHANRTDPPQLIMPIFWCGLAGFLAAMTVLTVRIFLSFRLPKKSGEEHDGHAQQP